MSQSGPIVCRPTSWFYFRAGVMVAMFGIFAVLFYIDGSTGYREKNEAYYLHKAFQDAGTEFSRLDAAGGLTPEEWKRHAEKQSVRFPEDRSVLPADIELPMAWPAVLHDYDRMRSLQWNVLWREFSGERGYAEKPVEEPYTARKIYEQWVVFWISLGLALAALFFLLRTMGRSIVADDQGVKAQDGRRVPYGDLKTLDLRKWETKGLAFVDYEGSGKGRIRIDGLTYGGFKKENDEPAEQLMRRIRSEFSGEILEYAPLRPEELPAESGTGAD